MKTIFINPSPQKSERRVLRGFALDALTVAQISIELFKKNDSIPEDYGFIVPFKNTDNNGDFYMYRIDGFSSIESQAIKFYIAGDKVEIKFMYMFKYAGVYLDITKKAWAQWLFEVVKKEVARQAEELKKALEAQTNSEK